MDLGFFVVQFLTPSVPCEKQIGHWVPDLEFPPDPKLSESAPEVTNLSALCVLCVLLLISFSESEV